jgi:hypothetical protein
MVSIEDSYKMKLFFFNLSIKTQYSPSFKDPTNKISDVLSQ